MVSYLPLEVTISPVACSRLKESHQATRYWLALLHRLPGIFFQIHRGILQAIHNAHIIQHNLLFSICMKSWSLADDALLTYSLTGGRLESKVRYLLSCILWSYLMSVSLGFLCLPNDYSISCFLIFLFHHFLFDV